MSVFDALGELIGKAFKSLFDSISGLLKFKAEQLSDIDRELAVASLDPEKYENPDVKKLVEELKKSLEHSPEGLSEWVETVFTKVFGTVSDVITKVMIPFGVPDFETAKANAGYLTSAFSGFILLAATLDAVSTAMSGTLVRNVFRYVAFMLQFFGFQRYMDIALMPAVNASILPMLNRGYNKQYRTFIPPTTDLINWVAKEVFEPTMRAKYGLGDEAEEIERDLFYEQGLSDEQIDNYWAAHWEHASWMQVVEMLYRGLITEDDVYEWFRLVEIPPFWRDLLIQTAYTWPTRVDVRRWWDMRTIDEAELRRLYSGMGYRGVNLDNYVLWTKVYVAFPDLMARWTNGWIREEDVRGELIALGMPAYRVEEMIKSKKKAVEAGQVEDGKTLTKTEIYKGVKAGTITRDEGIDLIMDLNYTLTQAEYLIDINVGALAGSPETYEEFKDITTKYKLAIGKVVKPMPEEIKTAAAEVVRLSEEVEALTRSAKEEEGKLIEPETAPEEATAHLKELRVSLHRTEAELAAAKDEYERLVAEWKHAAEK